MHRTFARKRSLIGGSLLALMMSVLVGMSQAQPPPVGSTVLVPLNGAYPIQMSTKKPIKKATTTRDGVINIRPVQGDPTKVLLFGQAADTTRLELTDEDGKVETYEVIVQRDIQNLVAQLRRAVPTGNIIPTSINETQVVLNGTIVKASDAAVVQQVAEGLGFKVINNVVVGGVQQVQLDVTVVLVSRSAFRHMAFDFLTNSKNFFIGSVGSGAVAGPVTTGTASALGTAASGLLGTVGTPNGEGTNILFGVLHNGYNFLGFLQALRDENIVKLMAEPKLITLSGTPASFLSGGEQAIPVPAGLGQIGVQFEEFGTRLNFLPIVLGDGRIHLEVEPEVSSLDAANGVSISGTTVPGRDTNRVHATVQLEDGHTFVIGGLIQHEVIASDSKVPVLGDLPFLGAFFSRKSYQDTENEVLILVTPHLVEAFDCSQAPKILPGQETRNPDDFELFLEGILEAPRGQRCVFQDGQYVPAYKNGPSASMYPCGAGCPGWGAGCGVNGCNGGCNSGCGTTGGCANGSCSGGIVAPKPVTPVAPVTPTVPQQLPQAQVIPPSEPLPAAPVMPVCDTAAATAPPVNLAAPVPPTEPLRLVMPPEPVSRPVQLPTTPLPPIGGQQ